jgi:hypothetical protein
MELFAKLFDSLLVLVCAPARRVVVNWPPKPNVVRVPLCCRIGRDRAIDKRPSVR